MSGARLPGIGAHHSARRGSDEWYTPPEILRALPGFDLDPCAPIGGPMPWAKVERWLCVLEDGLSAPWFVSETVWLNPPYSDVVPWVAKLAGHPAGGVALVFARTDTAWWFDHVWPKATALLFVAGRVTFWTGPESPSKGGHNSGGPSVLIAYGTWAADALEACSIPGAFVRLRP